MHSLNGKWQKIKCNEGGNKVLGKAFKNKLISVFYYAF
jgi:hypothetical protein